MEEEKILEPIIFTHEEFGEIRTFKKDGKILFAATDVCEKLDIQNTSQAVEDFDEDEKADISTKYISSNGVIQNRTILAVTELGLYKLSFRSRKPEAKKFQHWVTEEVLPYLRQTDTYNAEEPMQPLIFTHEEFGTIRMLGDRDNPKFCLADLCRYLELDASQVMKRLGDGVVSIHPIPDALGRIQNANFVNEDGLYDVILDSRKPSAKKFRKWITSEVLPSLRKTGSYSMPGNDNEKIVNIYFGGGGTMSEEESEKWLKEKKGETLVRLAKLRGSKNLTEDQEYILQKAFWYLTGEDIPPTKGKTERAKNILVVW